MELGSDSQLKMKNNKIICTGFGRIENYPIFAVRKLYRIINQVNI